MLDKLRKETRLKHVDYIKLSRFFSVFSDPTRVRIIVYLLGEPTPSCVNKIASGIGMNQPAISQQMRVLRNAGLVGAKREGKFIRYSVNDNHVIEILKVGISHINGGE